MPSINDFLIKKLEKICRINLLSFKKSTDILLSTVVHTKEKKLSKLVEKGNEQSFCVPPAYSFWLENTNLLISWVCDGRWNLRSQDLYLLCWPTKKLFRKIAILQYCVEGFFVYVHFPSCETFFCFCYQSISIESRSKTFLTDKNIKTWSVISKKLKEKRKLVKLVPWKWNDNTCDARLLVFVRG